MSTNPYTLTPKLNFISSVKSSMIHPIPIWELIHPACMTKTKYIWESVTRNTLFLDSRGIENWLDGLIEKFCEDRQNSKRVFVEQPQPSHFKVALESNKSRTGSAKWIQISLLLHIQENSHTLFLLEWALLVCISVGICQFHVLLIIHPYHPLNVGDW